MFFSRILRDTSFFICFGFFLGIPMLKADDVQQEMFEASLAKQSRYISEGRDNLTEGGIFAFEALAHWQALTANMWFGQGDSNSYKELNLGLEYAFEWRVAEFSFAYSRLEFLEENERDNELSVGVAFNEVFNITPAFNYVYSTEASGGFLEVSLRSKFEIEQYSTTIEPYVMEGFDFGFASKDHDGRNHFQVGVDFTVRLSKDIDFFANINHSWAHEDVKREGADDHHIWFTVGLATKF